MAKEKRRVLFTAKMVRVGVGDSAHVSGEYLLGGSDVTAQDAIDVAAKVMLAVNQQLHFAESPYRLAVVDAAGKVQTVTFKEKAGG